MTVSPPDMAEHGCQSAEDRPLAEISRLARLTATGPIPDAIRRLKRLAPAVGADCFVLFLAGRGSTAATRLMTCFDESFPARSPVTASLLDHGAQALLEHCQSSSLPAAWGMNGGSALLAPLRPILDDRAGIALPVSAEPGHTGVFVLSGTELAAGAHEIEELHLACFEMFQAVAQVRANSLTSAASISRREIECLMLTAAGRTSEDIARILGLSIHTANQYLTTAGAKLDAVNRTQAVAKAIRLGLIE